MQCVNKGGNLLAAKASLIPSQSLQLNYPKRVFFLLLKARALIASSLPAFASCQILPLSENTCQSIMGTNFPIRCLQETHRARPDGVRFQCSFLDFSFKELLLVTLCCFNSKLSAMFCFFFPLVWFQYACFRLSDSYYATVTNQF